MKKLSMCLTVTMLVISAGTAFIAFGGLGDFIHDVTDGAATVVEGTGQAAGTVLRGTGDVLTGDIVYDEGYEAGPEEEDDEEL